jgi:hypothetical protein
MRNPISKTFNFSTSIIAQNEPRALHNQLVQIKEEPMEFGQRPEPTASPSNMEDESSMEQQVYLCLRGVTFTGKEKKNICLIFRIHKRKNIFE